MKIQSKSDIAAVMFAVLGAIQNSKTSRLNGIPNGHLYTLLMSEFDIEQWQRIIAMLKDAGMITETNHLLQITPKGTEVFVKLEAVFSSKSSLVK